VAFSGLALSGIEEKREVTLAKRVRGRAEDGDSWYRGAAHPGPGDGYSSEAEAVPGVVLHTVSG
jgi:hypothetical protein